MRENNSSLFTAVNPYSILMDVLHNLVFIIMGTLAAGMAVSLLSFASAKKSYTTTATFAVTSQAYSNYAYNNLSAAQEMATTFTNVLSSDVMKNTIKEDLGLESFDATVSASQFSETNLLKITVSADTPQEAYNIIKSLMENYELVTAYATQEMIMDVLIEPTVPVKKEYSAYNILKQKKPMAAAFCALCALFILLSYRNDTVKSEQDFRDKLDTKSLGVIDHAGRGLKGIFGKKNKPILITDTDCGFSFTEKFRKIASAVMHRMDSRNAKVLMVTSCAEHEGKSTVALNLAMAMALATGEKVLLIDGDLRRSSVSRMMGWEVEKKRSLPDLIKGAATINECVHYDTKSGLFVLPSREKGYKNYTEIVSSEEMKTYINALRKIAKYIVIDTPPMGVMADAEAIAEYADMSMLVVKYDLVQAAVINDAIDTLNGANAEYIGAVLNDLRTLPGQGSAVAVTHYGAYGSYGKYGKYGGYGHYAEQKKQQENKSAKETDA